jgi:hypothetical protein
VCGDHRGELKTMDDNRPAWLPLVDLRAVTRDSEHVLTIIEVKAPDGYFYPWLKFGSLSDARENFLAAYYTRGVKDGEHKSAYAFHFDITGLALTGIHHGNIVLRAWIAGAAEDAEGFKAPSKGMGSLEDLGVDPCSLPDCEDGRHPIVDFTPSVDLALWKKLRGRELRITIIPVVKEDSPPPAESDPDVERLDASTLLWVPGKSSRATR